jgi:two-component system response regulator
MPDRSILLIEDSPEDAEAIMRALTNAGMRGPIDHVADGDSAMAYFIGVEEGRNIRPALVLLDLNLPGTDGREVLKSVKMNLSTTDIPVIVFTSSSRDRDIADCYQAGANSYLEKPVNYQGLIKTAETVLDYWFNTVLIPNARGPRQ